MDAYNNTASNYVGTVHFSSSDPAAVLPANAGLSGGTARSAPRWKRAGNQTVAATGHREWIACRHQRHG